jgi:phage replication O-like protein O
MANPQLEDGYTRIANELLEAQARIRVPGEARQVIDVVIRKTWGFGKKEDCIPLSQFSLSTGLKKPNCIRALNKAITMNLIIKKDNVTFPTYRINKDFDTWKPLSKKITLSKKIKNVIKKDKNHYPKRYPQKKKEKRNNNKGSFDSVIQDLQFMSSLQSIYPSVDIRVQIPDMRAWLLTNPPKKDYYKFIRNWVKTAAKGSTENTLLLDPIDKLSKKMGLQ